MYPSSVHFRSGAYGAAPALSASAGWYVGPGNWVYSVSGTAGGKQLVVAEGSPTLRSPRALDAATAQKVIAEIRAYGRYFGTTLESKAKAFQAAGLGGGGVTAPALPTSTVPGIVTQTAPEEIAVPKRRSPKKTALYQQTWFPFAVGGTVLAIITAVALVARRKRRA